MRWPDGFRRRLVAVITVRARNRRAPSAGVAGRGVEAPGRPMSPGAYRITVHESDDLVTWCWSGHVLYDAEFTSRVASGFAQIKAEAVTSKPVLLDISRMQYVYDENLNCALMYGILLKRSGYRVAMLLSPANRKMVDDVGRANLDGEIRSFGDREAALGYLLQAP